MIIGNSQLQKLPLSGSSGGRRIKVAATADPGTLIHAGPTDTAVIDEVWLDAYNSSASVVVLTIEWGSNTSPDDLIRYSVPPQAGLSLVIPGGILVGAASPLTIRAYAGTANVLTIGGYVNRVQ